MANELKSVERTMESAELKEPNIKEIVRESDAGKLIMWDGPDNPTLQILGLLKDEGMEYLKKNGTCCRSCLDSIWIRQKKNLICYCPILNSVTWQSSNTSASNAVAPG